MFVFFKEPIISSIDWVAGPCGFFLSLFLVGYFVVSRLGSRAEKQVVWLAFGFKSLMVLFSAWLYQSYYGFGDTFGYFHCARDLNQLLWSDIATWWDIVVVDPAAFELQERFLTSHPYYRSDSTKWVLKFCSILLVPGRASYLWLSYLMVFLSLWGLYQISSWTAKFEVLPPLVNRMVFFLVPSVLFWSTGVLKEPIIFFALGLMFHFLIDRRLSIYKAIGAVIGIFLIWHIKPYILTSLIAAYLLSQLYALSRSTVWKLGIVFVLILSFSVFRSSSIFDQQISGWSLNLIEEQLMRIQESQIESTDLDSGSGYVIEGFQSESIIDVIAASWSAFVTSMFRPYIWESRKPINLLSALENFVLLCLSFGALYFVLVKQRARQLWTQIPSFIGIWVVLLLIIVGLTSFNFGTLSRYRCIVAPFVFWYVLAVWWSVYGDRRSGERVVLLSIRDRT